MKFTKKRKLRDEGKGEGRMRTMEETSRSQVTRVKFKDANANPATNVYRARERPLPPKREATWNILGFPWSNHRENAGILRRRNYFFHDFNPGFRLLDATTCSFLHFSKFLRQCICMSEWVSEWVRERERERERER